MPDISQPHTFEANPEQRAVIEAAPNAHLLVVAGPGTGKTQVTELSLLKNHRSTEKLASMASSMRKILRSKELNSDVKLAAMKRFLGRLPSSSEDVKLGPHWLESLPAGSLAVLTRTNGEAVRVAKMLLGDSNKGPRVPIRLRLSGDTPFAPAWIAEILYRFKPQSLSRNTFTIVIAKLVEQTDPGVLKLMQLPSPDVAWKRLVRASGASEATQSIDLGELRSRMDWPDAFPDDQVSDAAAVYITTIHQAKGMEFDNVALLGVDPDKSEARVEEDPLEEANVGFVAITRAAKHLGQIPSSCIHKAPYSWTGKGGRVRQVSWWPMVNVQLGLKGDIAATSFVDADVHGSDVAVETLQKSLGARAIELRGHKVILKKVPSDKEGFRAIDTRYNIHLQDGNETGLLIGQTSGQVAFDLLHLLWNRG